MQFEFWSRSTADQISLSNKLFINFWCVSKMSTFVWSTSKNTFDRVTREKPWGVLRKYRVDIRLVLAVKLLYSCSEICELSVALNHNRLP